MSASDHRATVYTAMATAVERIPDRLVEHGPRMRLVLVEPGRGRE
jgi:hypothetical protein